MIIREIMRKTPIFCLPDTSLTVVAKLMAEHHIGEIPVIKSMHSLEPIGIITDRDIVCRVVATGANPAMVPVADCMSTHLILVQVDDSVQECARAMEEYLIRRVLVVDERGHLAGVVSQGDLARFLRADEVAKLIRDLSVPSEHASRLH
jgi:CBS domain-containing protein